MSGPRGRKRLQRRVSTPLVLALASAMVSTGLAAWWLSRDPDPDASTDGEVAGRDLPADTSSPERAAEAFLDAWRKRDHDRALSLSTGAARDAVIERRDEDAHATEHEKELKEQVWDQMARQPLHLQIRESRDLDDGGLFLRGIAEGEFLGNPYRRKIAFVLEPDGEQWKVTDMKLGDILTKMPDLTNLDPSRDPGHIDPQGQDVP